MKNEAQKNILFLGIAGVVFVALNAAILMATKNGHLAPIENLTLWGAFVVLNVSSLLWAVSLLGLHPLVIAFSYVMGGFVAFLGVRLLPEANVAEVTTAGATYGAFGALAVGHAMTKVRLVFFNKKQVPFIFVIAALLLVDGFLNSSVSGAGFGVIVHALVLPFVVAGIVVGLIWAGLARMGVGEGFVPASIESKIGVSKEKPVEDEMEQIMFKVPEAHEAAEEPAAEVVAPELEVEPVALKVVENPPQPELRVEEPLEDETNFFPLEIDKEDELILPEEDLSAVAELFEVMESTPERIEESIPVLEEKSEVSVEEPPVSDAESTPEPEEKKDSSSDWLSSHMDLLNNIKKAS